VREPVAGSKAFPVALAEKVADSAPLAGMKVVAVPEAENDPVRVPVPIAITTP